MIGSHRISVQNKRIRYDFTIRRNLTIIRGDSATGKTTLIDMIQEYYENGSASGIQLHSDKECVVLSGRDWEAKLSIMKDSIVFIDEGNEFIFTNAFAAHIQNTDNYYVFVTREAIPSLPYSIEEIYGIRKSGKYGTLKQTYNEFFHLYHSQNDQAIIHPQIVITEDSNAGYQFFQELSHTAQFKCESAGGKSNIFATVLKTIAADSDQKTLVIADGAAFGAEMEKFSHLLTNYKNLTLYLPESFEWMILQSGAVDDSKIREILHSPSEYIDSQKYFSWERFFTALLIDRTQNTYLKYAKKTLNTTYLNEKIREKILNVMEKVEL